MPPITSRRPGARATNTGVAWRQRHRAPTAGGCRPATSAQQGEVERSVAWATPAEHLSHQQPRAASACAQQRLDLRSDARVRVADPVTSGSTSSGAASGRPCSSVTITPSSRAMSSVQRSYGWQQSASARPRRGARSISGLRSATNRSWPAMSSYSWPPVEMY